MNLTIISPVSRPENLDAMRESICVSLAEPFEPLWVIVFDRPDLPHNLPDWTGVSFLAHHERGGIYGNPQRNRGLRVAGEGLVYFLDDDNIMHPRLGNRLAELVREHPGCSFAVGQAKRDGTHLRTPAPKNMVVSGVDTAQLVFQRDMLGADPWKNAYTSDGILAARLAAQYPKRWVYVKESLSYYNYLRPKKASRQ